VAGVIEDLLGCLLVAGAVRKVAPVLAREPPPLERISMARGKRITCSQSFTRTRPSVARPVSHWTIWG
jgi:hypothetical protein